ncbi:coiled-coil domain-containing protein 17 [Lethenteron reissneri]|uniref:coiled-coil domain-containing protein 17 n=1 Tax=Lethenteron reissneri TaxID=7753 RepID=UPI002AB6BAD7|nr:coiled-coil domain-containing protein 17 [Lethenteron reissneri]XP_061414094.1 coiled-coil domain-containing protein 17 [Lethenteron reissneri]XP_061414095.1 coiled-coil domain-containing protein 17 [Lethenteron reissneri]
MAWRCERCGMGFRSQQLKNKHRDRFCIGDVHGERSNTPSHLASQLMSFKKRREEMRTRRDMEEKLLLERERGILRREGSGDDDGDEQALGHLAQEFHKLRASIEANIATNRSWRGNEEDINTKNMQLRALAEAHGRQLAEIQARNSELEHQREDIRRKMEELSSRKQGGGGGGGEGVAQDNSVSRLIRELREQEQRNQASLGLLTQQLQQLQGKASSNPAEGTTEPQSNQNMAAFIPYLGGGSLSAEISAVRMHYLHSGGRDPVLLGHMQALQAEAEALEKPRPARAPRQEKPRHKGHKRGEALRRSLDAELLAVELENQRLEDEIFRLKIRGDRKRHGSDDELSKELQLLQREHMMKMAELEAEMDLLRQQMQQSGAGARNQSLMQHQQQPQPPLTPPLPHDGIRAQTPTLARHFLDPAEAMGPSPYDPSSGFIVFYDFISGLDPGSRSARLVVGLYHQGQEMGVPSPLPPVACHLGWPGPSAGLTATLATRQPVHRLAPSTHTQLLLELQVASAGGGQQPWGAGAGAAGSRLVSRGWAPVHLFDRHNRLMSGRWRVPLRLTPVRPGLTPGQVNAVPQLGRAEVFLRLVNARDAELQSLAPVDPSNAQSYHYQPLDEPGGRSAAEAPKKPWGPEGTQHFTFHPHPLLHTDPPPPRDLGQQRNLSSL